MLHICTKSSRLSDGEAIVLAQQLYKSLNECISYEYFMEQIIFNSFHFLILSKSNGYPLPPIPPSSSFEIEWDAKTYKQFHELQETHTISSIGQKNVPFALPHKLIFSREKYDGQTRKKFDLIELNYIRFFLVWHSSIFCFEIETLSIVTATDIIFHFDESPLVYLLLCYLLLKTMRTIVIINHSKMNEQTSMQTEKKIPHSSDLVPLSKSIVCWIKCWYLVRCSPFSFIPWSGIHP